MNQPQTEAEVAAVRRAIRRNSPFGDPKWQQKTGRQIVQGKSSMPAHLPPILERLGVAPTHWLELATRFGRLCHRVAGTPCTLARSGRWQRFRPGRAKLLGSA